MTTEELIEGLKQKSKKLFEKKDFHNAGKLNIAIDVLEEELRQEQKDIKES